MPNVMATLPNIGGASWSTWQSLADAQYWSAVQWRCQQRNPLKFAGCPKLPDRSQSLVGRSSPYCGNLWRRYCCLTSFFPIVDTCLSCEDIAPQSCAMVPRWRFLATFLRSVFAASREQHISDLHYKFALGLRHVSKYGRHPTCGRWD